MALKRKITKDAYDKLADNIKFEYVADGDSYLLQTEGDEDTGALKRANQRLKDQVELLEGKNDKLTADMEAINKNPARKNGDIETLTRQMEKEKETAVGEVQAKLEKRDAFIKSHLLENTANTLAGKISTAPAIMRPHIERRLDVDLTGDTPVIKVLDKDGKPSALTVDKLGDELVANRDFSAIIRVTKASGGAGSPSNTAVPSKQPGQQQQPGEQPPNLATMNPRQLADQIKAQKAEQQQAQQDA